MSNSRHVLFLFQLWNHAEETWNTSSLSIGIHILKLKRKYIYTGTHSKSREQGTQQEPPVQKENQQSKEKNNALNIVILEFCPLACVHRHIDILIRPSPHHHHHHHHLPPRTPASGHSPVTSSQNHRSKVKSTDLDVKRIFLVFILLKKKIIDTNSEIENPVRWFAPERRSSTERKCLHFYF